MKSFFIFSFNKSSFFSFVFLFTLLFALGCQSLKSDRFLLDKEWQYQISDNSDFKSLSVDKWKTVPSINRLTELVPAQEGIIWLRYRFDLPESLKAYYQNSPTSHQDSVSTAKKLAFVPGRIIWNDICYLNGQEIGQTGFQHKLKINYWNVTRFYPIPNNLLNLDKSNEILLKVYVNAEGSLSDIPIIGKYDAMQAHTFKANFLNLYINTLISTLLLFFSFYYLLIYYKRKQDVENLYYFIMSASFALYNVNMFYLSIPNLPDFSYLIGQKIILFFELLAAYFGARFFIQFFQFSPSKKRRLFLRIMTIVPLILILFAPDYKSFFLFRNIVMLFLFSFFAFFVYWNYKALRMKIHDAKPMTIGLAFLLSFSIHDVFLVLLGIHSAIYIAGWGFALFLFSIAFTLANKFVNVYNKNEQLMQSLEELNQSLEQKVVDRTRELKETLDQVQKLKTQQDGDYFLTSLLLNPLSGLFVRSQNVSVDFFLRQKKQFQFRQYSREIGGDLCTAHTIYLQNRPFTLFMNADAMGKSMQGAGGILVLGSVFQHILERTHTIPSEKNLFPEIWLKNTTIELHKILETFDGSMLVSMVLGLLDDSTGLVYFINAEHPFAILYRDGKASFIEYEMQLHKLGMLGMSGKLSVQTFQLLPGDAVLIGSDGKDEVRLNDESGIEIVNENEKWVLQYIEKGKGDPSNIFNLINNNSIINDDFSLMRIHYNPSSEKKTNEENQKIMETIYQARSLLRKEHYSEALQLFESAISMDKQEIEALKGMVHCHIKMRNYRDAALFTNQIIEMNPQLNDYVYLSSLCHRKAGNAAQAISLGERLRLRQHDHLKNLVNLSKSYLKIGNIERAAYIAAEGLLLDKNNAILAKIAQMK